MSFPEYEDAEIIDSFREESMEHLETVEAKLLVLERSGGDEHDINQIFRSVHTIKGGSGFLGFEKVKTLSHGLENLLDAIRRGRIQFSAEIVDLLLRGTDLLKTMVLNLADQDQVPIEDELARIRMATETHAESLEPAQMGLKKTPHPETKPAPDAQDPLQRPFLDKKGWDHYLSSGHFAYRLLFSKEKNRPYLTKKGFFSFTQYLNSFGSLVWQDGTLEESEPAKSEIIFITVLEPDFATLTLCLEEGHIQRIPRRAYETLFGQNPEVVGPESSPEPGTEQPGKSVGGTIREGLNRGTQATSVRVHTALLDRLMNLTGELVLARNQLIQKLGDHYLTDLDPLSQRLADLQSSVMETRLQPIAAVFNKVPRMVRELAKLLDKPVRVTLSGEEVELDRAIVNAIADPLMHLIRNSIDHGIEAREQRLARGKPAEGLLHLSAWHVGDQVNLEIADDGAGIDVARIKLKALELGICTDEELSLMGDQETLNLIFRPKFSTAERVTAISGRGVGLDVVKSSFEDLGGVVELQTKWESGTKIRVKLPSTLAIITVAVIEVKDQRFAIPQTSIEEIIRIKECEIHHKIERIGRYEIMRLRGKLIPIVRLADILQIERTYVDAENNTRPDRRKNLADRRNMELSGPTRFSAQRSGRDRRRSEQPFFLAILRVGQALYGVLVNRIGDLEEVLVKPLNSFFRGLNCFHGATIMGDGRVTMILDAIGLANRARIKLDALQDMSRREARKRQVVWEAEAQSYLIFTNHPQEHFALHLSFVARIEKVNTRDVEPIGDEEFIQLGGRNVPLFRLERRIACGPSTAREDGSFFVILLHGVPCPYGIVASQVKDVILQDVQLQRDVLVGPGVLGTAVIQDKMTLILDIYHLLRERMDRPFAAQKPSYDLLLVEDTSFYATLVRTYLEGIGHRVSLADNGQSALEKLQGGAVFDLLLCDLEMPEMNGFQLAATLKNEARWRRLPLLALSVEPVPPERGDPLLHGFDGLCSKLDPYQLNDEINRLLLSQTP